MAGSDDELQLEENDGDDDTDEGLQLEENLEDGLVLEDNEDEESSVTLEENEAPGHIASASDCKEEGNRAFKEGRLQDAREAYSSGLLAADANAERSILLTNRAACALRLLDWAGAINDCTAALSVSAASTDTRAKALFRRATAFLESGDAEGATRDLAQLPEDDAMVNRLRARLAKQGTGGATASGREGANGGNGAAGVSAGRRRRVSCISPTTPERQLFHERALYRCFNAQTHPDIELIVVDTGATPSPFFTDPSFSDQRVTYLHQERHQTIGEKRNLAIQHASGDIICHFDDDDLYAPEYVATMVRAMEAEGADFVKLSSWLVHDLQTGVSGLFDADTPMPHSQLTSLREQFLFTYGFSFLYRRALFPTFSFLETSWGEDQDILRRVREAGRRIALHRDLTGICLHNQHGENCSRSFAQAAVSDAMLRASPLGPMLDALPLIGRALTTRLTQADGGSYALTPGKNAESEVVIKSEVVGGLFVWVSQLERNGGNVKATLDSFTKWLWSGNGFSKERYAKLGLERPRPPDELIKKVAAEQQSAITASTMHGLESLRLLEGKDQPHAPGAITNPIAYREPERKSAMPGFTASFGNPTRGFTP